MRRRNHTEYDDSEKFSPWESYSDLFCGLLLVFVLLFFFSIFQYIAAREKNDADTIALQEQMKEEQASVLALYKADLEDQVDSNEEKRKQLEEEKQKAEAMQKDLDEKGQELKDAQSELDRKSKEVEDMKKLLDEQKVELEKIIGVRQEIVEDLNRELKKNNIQIQADKTTGAIVFESNILFPKDSNELSNEGKQFLAKFAPVYLSVILQDKYKDSIAEIIVEGHTDRTGTYLHNLDLSQKRAYSVAEFFMSEKVLDSALREETRKYLTVNGCADKDMIYSADGKKADYDKSRRVEIKFRLMDQEMIQQMDDILSE